jgi:Asp-tRNA(Asn)/Glu-tRNA(Gln) amidotransferase C subunit
MQFHTARLRISEEELESMRIKMSQSSPLHDALEVCLSALQHAVLHDSTSRIVPEVIAGLCGQLQRGVGLPTRVAAAQALSQMVERYPAYLVPGSTGAKSTAEAFRSIIWSLSQAPNMATSLKKAMTSAFGVLSKVRDDACDCISLFNFVTLLTCLPDRRWWTRRC